MSNRFLSAATFMDTPIPEQPTSTRDSWLRYWTPLSHRASLKCLTATKNRCLSVIFFGYYTVSNLYWRGWHQGPFLQPPPRYHVDWAECEFRARTTRLRESSFRRRPHVFDEQMPDEPSARWSATRPPTPSRSRWQRGSARQGSLQRNRS